jgi:hypothetical protein
MQWMQSCLEDFMSNKSYATLAKTVMLIVFSIISTAVSVIVLMLFYLITQGSVGYILHVRPIIEFVLMVFGLVFIIGTVILFFIPVDVTDKQS